jgi:hypothetical protein
MPFKKENLDLFLKELAKEFRKRSGKSVPAEIILIGGASVVINYGFREMTYDIDAIINASSSMKEAINYVSDKYGLPNGWMNDDFRKTASYSPKIVQFSKYYRTYANSVSFRTVSGEYLVAMKMMSGRKYKYDLSDIIGVLREQEKRDDSLTLERIKTAVEDLYGSYEKISDEVRQFVEQAIQNGEYAETYASVRKAEAENREVLLEYQDNKPGVITNDNINEIIIALRKRKGQE